MTEQKETSDEDTVPAASADGAKPAETVAAPASDETVLSESRSTGAPPGTIPVAVAGGATIPPPGEAAAAEEAVAAEWAEGDVILDLYEVKGLLGEGGMGKVYLVRHRGWNLDLAVKSPRADYFQTEEQKQNFVRECETWIDLGLHPHTVSCYYVRTLGGIPRVFAEYVEGGSLSDWIESGKLYEGGEKEALKRMLDVAIQFAWGLGYAHERGLIHQDVKPANVMLTREGEAKVTDFGLAQARPVEEVEVSDGKGGTVLVKGRGLMTPAYCSPEQAAGEELSRKTDVWSWGVSVLEMFVGERTWEHGQAASLVLESYPEAEQEDKRVPRMPKRVAELLGQCFAHEPSERPQDMSVVVERLKECYRTAVGEEYERAEPKPAELLADALNNRAVSLLDLGRREEAEKLFDEALKSDPHQVEATYNRGLVLWRSGRMTDDVLVKQLEEVRTTHEADWRDEYYLGLVHMERGDAEAAIKVLQEAAEAAPEKEETERALALVSSSPAGGLRLVRTFDVHEEGRKQRKMVAACVACSLDGRWGLSGSWGEKGMRLWELATGACLRVFGGEWNKEGPRSWVMPDCLKVSSVSIGPENRWALSGNYDNALRLWDLATGQCVRVFEGHTGRVNSVAISSDGHWALSGSNDNTLRLWELARGRCVQTFEGHTRGVQSVAISSDGRWALSGSHDQTLRFWKLTTGACLRVLKGHTRPVNTVSICRDGLWGLSGSNDRTLRLWELATGKCIRTFEHNEVVVAASMTPDGSWGLSASKEPLGPGRTLRVWELATGRCVRTSEMDTTGVSSISISSDGCWALTNGVMRLWELKGSGPCAHVAITRPRSPAEQTRAGTAVRRALAAATSALGQGDARRAAEEVLKALRIPGYQRHRELLEVWHRVGLLGKPRCLSAAWGRHGFEGHMGRVLAVAIGPDAHWALSGHWDKTMALWELATGRCLRTFEVESAAVSDVAISPDGRWGLCGDRLCLWELATGKRLHDFVGWRSEKARHVVAESVSISPDGRLALSGETGRVSLWELATGKCLNVFELSRHGAWVTSVSFSPDGRRGLAGCGHMMWLLELATGECLQEFEGHTNDLRSVAITPDGGLALSGSKDRTLRLWELATAKCLQTFEGHTDSVNSVSISPDGRWAFSGSSDKTLRLWQLATGHCVRTLQWHTRAVGSVAISPDGRWVLSGGSDSELRLWELVWDYDLPDPVDWDESARPYLQIFLTLHCPNGDDGISRVGTPSWNDEDVARLLKDLQYRGYGWLRPEGVRKQLDKMVREQTAAETSVRKALDGATSALEQGDVCRAATEVSKARRLAGYERHDQLLKIWSQVGVRGKRKCLGEAWQRRSSVGHTKEVYSVAFSPDGGRALSGSSDKTLRLWKLRTGKCVRTFEGHAGGVYSISISPDGGWALSASSDKTLRLWELFTGKCVRVFEGHMGWVHSVAFSPDGHWALSGSSDKTLRLWKLGTGKCVRTFEGHAGGVYSVSISPDGRWALSSGGTDNALRLWDLTTAQCVRVFEGHTKEVYSVAFSPDGGWALSGSSDKTLRLWKLGTGQCVRVFEGRERPMPMGWVSSVTISPDGRWALSGSYDKALRVWELGTGECVRVLEGHLDYVYSVAFSPDGGWALWGGGKDERLRLWELVWDYHFPDPADWDEGARPYLQIFLTLHCPYGDDGISRVGKPSWNDENFAKLIKELQYRGYGWLRPEGVRRELEKMTREWEGPPRMPWETQGAEK